MSVFEYHHAGNSEAQQKAALSYLLNQVVLGKAAPGVFAGLAVTQTPTASGSVLIGSGAAVTQATTIAGASFMVNDTQLTLDVFTANPVGGLPRNDIVVIDSGTTTIRVIVGTPNAVPTDPTVPTTALALARLRHAASATTIPTAKIDALAPGARLAQPPGTPYAVYSGSGVVGGSIAPGVLAGPYAQTFPAGRFTVAPNITLGGTDSRCTPQATGVSATGFNLYLRNNSSSTAPAGQTAVWTATQMTPTTASG